MNPTSFSNSLNAMNESDDPRCVIYLYNEKADIKPCICIPSKKDESFTISYKTTLACSQAYHTIQFMRFVQGDSKDLEKFKECLEIGDYQSIKELVARSYKKYEGNFRPGLPRVRAPPKERVIKESESSLDNEENAENYEHDYENQQYNYDENYEQDYGNIDNQQYNYDENGQPEYNIEEEEEAVFMER
eukprot:GHVL01020581.1.p2 GENE.GHVL01020581.1~~GHVL01020581.1.p2  ORF type:complete len:189 (+),score=51.38 GHVL01020581.1:277-843(+)